MAKPAILVIDDDPEVLKAVARDLRGHLAKKYRVMEASSGAEALGAVRRLKERDAAVALFLSDQRMPAMTGTEFLAEAGKLYPRAGKVLLTAYADTEVAISSINEIGLDHYLIKPWDPPEEKLFPVIDDVLYGWEASAEPSYDGIRVAGTQWSPHSHEIKDFLARNNIPYRWLDIEKDAQMRVLLDGMQDRGGRLPVVLFPDGSRLIEPTKREIAEKLNIQTEAKKDFYDLVVIGAGPAGLASGVYGAAEGLRTCVIEKAAPGGQAGTSSLIENYLGFPGGIGGADLAKRAADQCRRLGTELLLTREVKSVEVEEPYRIVTLADGARVRCFSVILATGMTVRRLNVPGEEKFYGRGIYYGAALTEADNYRGQHMFVIGGANSAGQAAMWFHKFAKKLTIVIRGPDLVKSMSQYLIDRIAAADNIELLTHTEVVRAEGDKHLERVTLRNSQSGEEHDVDARAMFIFIGSLPHTGVARDLVQTDEKGFVVTGSDLVVDGKRPRGWKRDPYLLETSVPGVFAVGDVRAGSTKRVNAAIGEGSVAVKLAWEYVRSV